MQMIKHAIIVLIDVQEKPLSIRPIHSKTKNDVRGNTIAHMQLDTRVLWRADTILIIQTIQVICSSPEVAHNFFYGDSK